MKLIRYVQYYSALQIILYEEKDVPTRVFSIYNILLYTYIFFNYLLPSIIIVVFDTVIHLIFIKFYFQIFGFSIINTYHNNIIHTCITI